MISLTRKIDLGDIGRGIAEHRYRPFSLTQGTALIQCSLTFVKESSLSDTQKDQLETNFLGFARAQTLLVQSLTAKVKEGDSPTGPGVISIDLSGKVSAALIAGDPVGR